jgi:hypothetical protein
VALDPPAPPLAIAPMPTETKLVGRQAGDVRDDNGLKLKLAWCPPGSFQMGSPASVIGVSTPARK